ncbi:MAG: hypothetical protein N3A02_02500, partial [Rectinema sp.]|nr:hypothetical protein [Rectinema sp.]
SAASDVYKRQGGKLHISSFPFQKSSSGAGARALAEQSGLSASNASFDLYIDAKSALISNLPILDGVTLPFDGLRFIAVRDEVNALVGNADAVYQARFNIRMKDEQSARAFRPIMRLIWVVLSAQISSMGLPIPPEASIELKGSIFETQPFPVHAHEIVDILRTMAEKSGALPSTVAIR